MEILLQILIGVALSATCGFRVFVPLLVMGIANISGYLTLSSGFEWIGSYPAVIVFAVATAVEITAYFFPYIDNVLNTISIPVSIVAGIIVTASVITGIDPILQWSLAIIVGGGVATATSLVSSGVHGVSTVVSGGAANPIVSTVESAGSVITAVLAVAVPVLAVVLLILLIVLVLLSLRKFRKKNAPEAVQLK